MATGEKAFFLPAHRRRQFSSWSSIGETSETLPPHENLTSAHVLDDDDGDKWRFNVTGYSIGTFTHGGDYSAVLSSTTSFIRAPNETLDRLVQQLGAEYDPASLHYSLQACKI